MYKAFYQGNPLLLLPVISMFIFAAVFLAAVVRVWRRKGQPQVERVSALPLLDDTAPLLHAGERHE